MKIKPVVRISLKIFLLCGIGYALFYGPSYISLRFSKFGTPLGWTGIQLGITNGNDALQIVEKMLNGGGELKITYETLTWHCPNAPSLSDNQVHLDRRYIVDFMMMSNCDEMTLGELQKIAGNPQAFIQNLGKVTFYFKRGIYVSIDLIPASANGWKDTKGMRIVEINASTKFDAIAYSDPNPPAGTHFIPYLSGVMRWSEWPVPVHPQSYNIFHLGEW